MGIYDREYYRREGPRYLDALSFRGQACKWLIIVNIVVFVLQLLTRDRFTGFFALFPDDVLAGEIWRLATYAFLHDTSNILHIVVNMWMLFMFGGYVEERYGSLEFLAFYLLAGTVGGLAYQAQAMVGFHLNMMTPCIGASGAVMAVTILCAFVYPTMTILLFFVLPVPIWVLALILVVQDTFGVLGGAEKSIAFSVHLGGAAFAALYHQLDWRFTGFLRGLQDWKVHRSRPRLRVYRGEEDAREAVAVAAPPPQADLDEHLEAKVDAVLEKVARHGQASLTDAEKQVLLRASEIYKKRRS